MGKRRRGWSVLSRGESLLASAAAPLAGLLIIAAGAIGWWAVRHHHEHVHQLADQSAGVTAELAARSLDDLIAQDKQSLLRATLAELVTSAGLAGARLIDDQGNILESFESPDVLAADTGAIAAPLRRTLDGARVSLEIDPAEFPDTSADQAIVGMGAIGGVSLLAGLFTYRAMRRKLRAIGAVQDALLAAHEGVTDPELLAVDARFGTAAVAWNALLDRASRTAHDAGPAAAESSAIDALAVGACDALWTGVIVVDRLAKVRYLNGACSTLLSVKRDESLGVEIQNVIKDEHVLAAIREGAKAGKLAKPRLTFELERGGPDPAGRGVLRLTLRSLREEAGAVLVVIEDVTQQRVAEESRSSFVAQVTHELRTPLTNVRLYLETLHDEGETDPSVRAKCINVIGQETRRLERVVQDMLSVSEIEAGSFKLHVDDVRTDEIFEELKNDYTAQAQDREIRLVFDLAPKLPVLQADRDKVSLALHNLVGNALKYTPVGGEVRVKAEEADGLLTVHVTDNGIGIKEDEHELIFEKFYRAKDQRINSIVGSGLGLALARQVIRMHNGDITVQSQLNKGSTFTLTVPLAPGATPAGLTKAAA
ncbi:MAG: hypothetical protein JNL50_00975 [Phycisphaerae bacterium]|nr:hypothetical protein [Phycisphaerae bacterium]